jgi:hypothetical protein
MSTAKRGVAKRVADDLNKRDLALRRLGATWKDRLRWAVHEFARRDLTLARPEELVALGYDLRVLPQPVGTMTSSPHAPMPVRAIKRLHTQVNAGLRRLLSTDSAGLQGGWVVPPPKRMRLVRIGDVFMWVQESRDEIASAVAAIGELIVHAGEDLKSCPECGRPFIRTGRRAFCEERCSMRVRNRNRPKEKKGTVR